MAFNPEASVHEFGFMPGERVADLLAGVGHLAFALERVVTDTGWVYAIDRKEAPLLKIKNEALRQGLENIDVVMGDIELERGSLLKDELVSGAVFGGGLSKVRDVHAALGEVKRILRPQGRVVIVEWAKREPNHENIKGIAASTGFIFEREFAAGEDYYGLIFKKA